MNTFNITNHGTWDFASDTKPFVWKNKSLYNYDKTEKLSELQVARFIMQYINGLQESFSNDTLIKKGIPDIISLILELLFTDIEQKIVFHLIYIGIKNDIDFKWSIFNFTQNDNKEIFDIYNINTYKFATDNALLLNNKEYYRTDDNNVFTEKLFVKIMYLIFYSSFDAFYKNNKLCIKAADLLLEGLQNNKEPTEILNEYIEYFKNVVSDIQRNRSVTTNNNINNTNYSLDNNKTEFNLTPPSLLLLIFGIGCLIGGLILLFIGFNDFINDFIFYFGNVSKFIISIIIMIGSIPFFYKYSKEKKRYHYNCVCYEMSRWVGSSANDLIMKWGSPTKTYKFPTDKTMTVLEYKDSIRNYAGYRYKGMYAGQAKTTKYIKSFFVKNDKIIDYKYSIT